ncbi:hypothetical protein SDC9_123796 [bioreactor metagenome]|uniref:Uncharacterized protein n=1 Tax=bioreactor metagenome TaxID=1076179 RepID=A0A645CIL0_9ZZZZ
MHFAAGALVGLHDPLHVLDNAHGPQHLNVDGGGISDKPQNRVIDSDGVVHSNSLLLQPLPKRRNPAFIGALFQNDNHVCPSE